MLTIGDAFAAFTLQAAEPDATGWKVAFSSPRSLAFSVEPDAAVRLVSPSGLSVGRNPQEAMSVPGALQSGGLCRRNGPQRGEHLKAA